MVQKISHDMCANGIQAALLWADHRRQAHLALLSHEDGQLVEVVAGRLADNKGLHCRILDAVHVQRQRPDGCPHHAIPVRQVDRHNPWGCCDASPPRKFDFKTPGSAFADTMRCDTLGMPWNNLISGMRCVHH